MKKTIDARVTIFSIIEYEKINNRKTELFLRLDRDRIKKIKMEEEFFIGIE